MRGLVVAVVLLAGCKSAKKAPETKDAAPEAKPIAVAVSIDAAPAPPPKPAATTLMCDQVLTAELLAAHFPNMSVHETLAPQFPGAMCELSHDYEFATLAVTCLGADMTQATMDFGKSQMEDVKELGVGKRAYVGKSMGMETMNLWDGESDCVATIGGFSGDPTALAKAVEAALTAEIGERLRAHANEREAQPSSATATCAALLPDAVREAHYPLAKMTESDARDMDTVSCELAAGAKYASVNVTCDKAATMAMGVLRDMLTDPVDLKVGKNAHAGTMQGKTVMDLVEENDCFVNATGFSGDATALATAIDAALTPELAARIRRP